MLAGYSCAPIQHATSHVCSGGMETLCTCPGLVQPHGTFETIGTEGMLVFDVPSSDSESRA